MIFIQYILILIQEVCVSDSNREKKAFCFDDFEMQTAEFSDAHLFVKSESNSEEEKVENKVIFRKHTNYDIGNRNVRAAPKKRRIFRGNKTPLENVIYYIVRELCNPEYYFNKCILLIRRIYNSFNNLQT